MLSIHYGRPYFAFVDYLFRRATLVDNIEFIMPGSIHGPPDVHTVSSYAFIILKSHSLICKDYVIVILHSG